ncbi:hypothetical protein F4677DRAFT_403901 [Hypoxylon crocopeplum]|nr:hypothetical protein F4677DRAFT_403901 [Hypoxylon crocopeplum]
MRTSILTAIYALVVSALALPGPSSKHERRQTVNVPWFITNWYDYGTNNITHKHTVRFMIGAPDAYVEGFYGFSGWCDPVPVNWWNATVCFGGGDQWHVETKVSHNRATNRTGIWVRHAQSAFGTNATATGSTDNFIPTYPSFELYPTDVEGF